MKGLEREKREQQSWLLVMKLQLKDWPRELRKQLVKRLVLVMKWQLEMEMVMEMK